MFRLMLLGALAVAGWATVTVGDVLAADSPVPGYVAAALADGACDRVETGSEPGHRLVTSSAAHLDVGRTVHKDHPARHRGGGVGIGQVMVQDR